MVVLNYSEEEINAKVVYYGPGLSGKTTNLDHIHKKMPAKVKGEMVSMKTRTDRTLFFDFLPLEFGDIGGYKTRFLLYTVPGQVYYNATRKLVLKGTDAVVFVADSSQAKMQENIESLRNLEDNLNEYGLSLDHIPWVLQYNKRDAADAVPVEQLHENLNLLNVPAFEAVATNGTGVYETFETIARLVYRDLQKKLETGDVPVVEGDIKGARKAQPGFEDAIDSALREMDSSENGAVEKTVAPKSPAPVAPARKDTAAPAAKSPTPADGNVYDITEAADDSYEGVVQEVRGQKKQVPASKPAQGRAKRADAVEAPKAAGPVVSPASPKGSPADETRSDVLSLVTGDEPASNDVGRTVELDDLADALAHEEDQTIPEFITDPMVAPQALKGKPEKVEETIELEIPVVLSRSQVRRTLPIKLRLNITVIDD